MFQPRSFSRLAVALLLFSVSTFADDAATKGAKDATDDRRKASAASKPTPAPFEPSEELIYEGEFSRLLLRGIKIAEFKFTSGRAQAHQQATPDARSSSTSSAASASALLPLLFTGEINSRGWFRKLFGINFHFRVESLVEPQSFGVLRTTKLDEQGKRVRTSEAVFDRAEHRVTWTERDPNDPSREPRVVNSTFAGTPHDIITAIYYLRTQTLTPGKTFELTVSDSGQVFRVPMKVVAEKKRMKSVVGRVAVVRVDVELFGQDRLVREDGRMSLWITDDARRLPIRARISSDMGTVDITLKSINGKAAS
ncbi:MAG TPA: DUF3108 domain-containing protein [Pyrinomonadaceae bacterium]|jgi:hypothetical protein